MPVADEVLSEDFEPGGTPSYMSMEAVQRSVGSGGHFDLRAADAYGAGATLFQLLTGRLPIEVSEEELRVDDELEHHARMLAWERRLLSRVRPALRSCHAMPWSPASDAVLGRRADVCLIIRELC